MKIGIIVFPGTSSERDVAYAINDILQKEAIFISSDATSIPKVDALILAGGASYGNYVRPGACAIHQPIMESVVRWAEEGKPLLGISNGFQMLLELKLLPGAMLSNESLTFTCKMVHLTVENNETMFTSLYAPNETITLPIAHADGLYTLDEKKMARLKENNQIVFKYKENVNGAQEGVAAIINEGGNVLGMMPYPERAVERLLGSDDGLTLFQSIVQHWRDSHGTV